MRRGIGSRLAQRLWATAKEDVFVCSVVRAELLYGAEKSAQPASNLAVTRAFLADFPSVPFDDLAAEEYGRIRLELERRGTPVNDANDLLIAAVAVTNGLILVTHDGDFSGITGLHVEDWQ